MPLLAASKHANFHAKLAAQLRSLAYRHRYVRLGVSRYQHYHKTSERGCSSALATFMVGPGQLALMRNDAIIHPRGCWKMS